MKLSFATGGWPFSMDQSVQMALDMHYEGLEISAASLPRFIRMGGPLSPARLSDTARSLNEAALSISAIAADAEWNKEMVHSLIHADDCGFVLLPPCKNRT